MPIPDVWLTSLVVAALFGVAFWKSSPRNGLFSFDKQRTTYLKGFCAIVVVFTHVPEIYGNPVQKAVHSFGFVAVTLFFLISAFGMSTSLERTPEGYLSHFWRNRLASLLVPCVLVNGCWVVYTMAIGQTAPGQLAARFFLLPRYVLVLLQYCLLFYVVMRIRAKTKLAPWTGYAVLGFGVIVSSLCAHFAKGADRDVFSAWNGWACERWGLVWGMLLFLFWKRIATSMDSRRRSKSLVAGMLSAALGIAYLSFKTVPFWGDYLLKTALGLGIICFVFLVVQNRKLGNGVTDWLGRISYEIYLSHGLAAALLVHCFPHLSSGPFIVSCLGMTLVISTGIHAVGSRIVSRLRIRSVQ